jgi:outer membrane protein assembly factor BamB
VRRVATTICCSALALAIASVQLLASTPGTSTIPIFPAVQQWTIALNNALIAQPGFNGSRGYFPIEGDRLVAYDLAAGHQLWLVSSQPVWPPVAADDLVFVVHRDAIVALRANDGTEAWRFALEDRLAVRPVVDDRWLVAATISGSVLAIRVGDGGVGWRSDVNARISAPPALTPDRIYLPLEDRRVLALQAADGAAIWERRVGGPPTGVLALEDRVYVGATDNFLYCLDARRGEISWRWRTGADVIGTPVVDDDRLYFVALDNILRSLDRRGGSQKWKRALPLRPRGSPLLAASTLIIGGLTPSVRGYAMATGAPAGDVTLPADLAAAPHLFWNGGVPVLVAVTADLVKGATVIGLIPGTGLPTPFAALPNPPTVPPLTVP